MTLATQASRQAGGVARTSLERRARDRTEETTVEVRIASGSVCVVFVYVD